MDQEAEAEENKDEDAAGPVYFVSSCNDWTPVKMKTKRVLHLEKLPMTEPAPPHMLEYDNMTLTYSNFVSPGAHYFYFMQGRNRVFLSPNYPVVKFKATSVVLNRVVVKPKVHEFESVFTLKEGVEDEELFLLDHSVFAKYEME